MMSTTLKISGVVIMIALFVQWLLAFVWVPVDELQGEVYRIIYIHVPAAFAAFASCFALLWTSIGGLRSHRGELYLPLARASTEVGLIFTILTLATGSIWGKPTWGTWWTWDARLTTTLLLALLQFGWLLLFHSLTPGPSRTKSCSLLGMLIAIDVPIIYKSVTLWRTLHQPQTILRPGGSSTIDPQMLQVLVMGVVIMLLVCGWLTWVRRQNILMRDQLDELSLSRL
jgi:heme exporter protein C